VRKRPRGKQLKPGWCQKHGRFFTSRAKDCRGRALAALCLSKGRASKAVVLGEDYPALERARRRRARWSEADHQLYQRHRWRSEGVHGEAKAWHGLARAVRRGLDGMRIQPAQQAPAPSPQEPMAADIGGAFLTAAAINLKRLAVALLARLGVALRLLLLARQSSRGCCR
jgi:hypothetical protein